MVVDLPGAGKVRGGGHAEEVPLGNHGPQQVLCKQNERLSCVV